MKFFLHLEPQKADVLFLPLYKGEIPSKKHVAILGSVLNKQVDARIKAKDFEGEEGQVLTLFTEQEQWKKVVLVGRGSEEEMKKLPQATEHLGAKLADLSKSVRAQKVEILLKEKDLEALGYGFTLSAYEFKKYKSIEKKTVELKELHFLCPPTAKNKKIVEKISVFAKVSPHVRDLINTCANEQNPENVAEETKDIAKQYGMKISILNDTKLRKLGCGAIVAMGQGAKVGSRMILLEHRYKSKSKNPNIAFVGKGITFDSGGLNLKPSGHIEDMKLDMAGAATVLGTLQAIAELKIPGYFLGVLCCAENALSDRSIHPGDVVRAYNGKTIEICNTDAEGRMVLADGLAYTEKNYQPKIMVDLATLTGAVTVALGYCITGLMSNNDKLLREAVEVSKVAHERAWPLPLDEDFIRATKGSYSDLKNATDGVRAGTIMGAAFLRNFVKDTPWLHIDFAGTAWAEKPTPTTKYGATAACLRTLVELAHRHAG